MSLWKYLYALFCFVDLFCHLPQHASHAFYQAGHTRGWSFTIDLTVSVPVLPLDRAVWATLLVPVLMLLFGWAAWKHFSVGSGLCSGCWHSGDVRKTWHREDRTAIFTSSSIWLQFHNQCNPVINDVYIGYMLCSCTFHRDFCAALFNYTDVFVSFGLKISRWFLI